MGRIRLGFFTADKDAVSFLAVLELVRVTGEVSIRT
jgi:hypothetical protein